MVYTTEYASPLGAITLACDEEAIIGLWFNGQRYFGNILPKRTEQKERPLFADAKRWLDIYFSGREPDFLPRSPDGRGLKKCPRRRSAVRWGTTRSHS